QRALPCGPSCAPPGRTRPTFLDCPRPRALTTRGRVLGRRGREGGFMGQRPSFNLSRMSTASRILLIGSLLYFIDLFLAWQHACVGLAALGNFCVSQSGWHGIGIINGILAILILVMEIVVLANVEVNMGTPSMRNMVEAGLAG